MQKNRLIIMVLMLLMGWSAAHASGFLQYSEDLPLAPGLTEQLEDGLVFDAPGGRIVEAYARGAVKAADVLKFYAATLPQLGWVRDSDLTYRRDTEKLRLDLNPQGHVLLVHFTLSPE